MNCTDQIIRSKKASEASRPQNVVITRRP